MVWTELVLSAGVVNSAGNCVIALSYKPTRSYPNYYTFTIELTFIVTGAHVSIPFLVIFVLGWVSTAPISNCCFVCISVKNIYVSKSSAHFDTVVTRTAIMTLLCLAVSLRSSVCAYALWAILHTSIVISAIGTNFYTPENGTNQMYL